jgi:hypothetical protein
VKVVVEVMRFASQLRNTKVILGSLRFASQLGNMDFGLIMGATPLFTDADLTNFFASVASHQRDLELAT